MKRLKFSAVAAIVAIFLCAGLVTAGTLADVKAKGFISVGVNEGLFGFSKPDEKGVWGGLDVDTARAISVAVFGSPDKIKFIPLTAKTRFTALQSGEIDVLTRNATQTLTRESSLGLNFAHVNYYDGQGFLVPKKLGVKSAKELDGATICVLPGTTTELNAADFFRANKMTMKPVVIESTPELAKAFFAGRCDSLTSDASQLAGTRAVAPNPDDYVILPEIISREPLAPAVRHGDDQWFDIVNFATMAMIEAEYLGISSKNVDDMLKSGDPQIQRFLGVNPGNGEALGLGRKMGLQHRQDGRQLRRGFRTQRGRQHAAEARTRFECPVDQGRNHVHPAV
jgi:general L-amino acid transport system substrate-binding protein